MRKHLRTISFSTHLHSSLTLNKVYNLFHDLGSYQWYDFQFLLHFKISYWMSANTILIISEYVTAVSTGARFSTQLVWYFTCLFSFPICLWNIQLLFGSVFQYVFYLSYNLMCIKFSFPICFQYISPSHMHLVQLFCRLTRATFGASKLYFKISWFCDLCKVANN